jgi:hypothetical protein
MSARHADWERAAHLALEAFERAVRGGVGFEAAVDIAVARVRAVIPSATEDAVREVLATKLAEKRLGDRSAKPDDAV